MNPLKDQTYLKTEQYKDSSNLHARATLHTRFNTNSHKWHPWVFDHLLTLPANSHILELGCGSCYLWQENHKRIPNRWTVVLSDLSPGMLEKAKQNLASANHAFTFQEIDAQILPFPDQSQDAVVGDDHASRYDKDDYTLENGQRLLSPWFAEVVLHQYESRLEVTEVEPLYEYMMSGLRYQVSDDRKAEFRAFLTKEMAEAGGMIRIDGATGLFEATR